MDGSKNASRLGGLTVAVGLGIAVSSGQGVAYADTDSSDSGSAGSSVSAGSSDTDSAAPSDSEQRVQPTRRGTIRSPGRDAESAAAGDAPRRELSPRRLKIREALRSADEAAESSTGETVGKLSDAATERAVAEDSLSSVAADKPTAAVDSVADLSEADLSATVGVTAPVAEETVAEVEPVEVTEALEPVEPVDPAVPPAPSEELPAAAPEPETGSAPEDPPAEDPAVDESRSATHRDEAALGLDAGSDPGDATADPTGTTISLDVVAPEAVSNPLLAVQVSSQTDPVTLTGTPSFHPIVELLAVPLRIVTGLLGLVGLAPGATVPGAPVAPVTKLLELAWVALRRVNSFFFNSTPTATVTLDPTTSSSVITGRVVGYDPDGDPLEYRLVEQPTHGAVQLNADGTFTYHATAAAVAAGVTDTFRISVVDKGFHFHGLLGFLKPGRGHGAVVDVAVNLAATNAAPVIERVTTVTNSWGVVTGTIRVTDDSADPVHLTWTQPAAGLGNVHVTQTDTHTWQWTFSPDPARPPAVTTAAFTLTASDGARTTVLPVEVNIQVPTAFIVESSTVYIGTPAEPSETATYTVVDWPGNNVVIVAPHVLVIADEQGTITETLEWEQDTNVVGFDRDSDAWILANSDHAIKTATIGDSGLVISDTGIVLPDTPISVTVVGGGLSLGGGLVINSGSSLGLYGAGQEPLTVTGMEAFGTDTTFKEVAVVTNTTTVAATSPHAMSLLMVGFNLGARAMSGDAAQSNLTAEVVGTVEFGDGVVGKLATRGESVYVTVTEGDITRLIKYDVNYYGFEEQSSVELTGTVSGLAISEDGRYAYVADSAAGTVSIIEIQEYDYGMDVIETIHTGPGHISALSGGRLALTDAASGSVTIMTIVALD